MAVQWFFRIRGHTRSCAVSVKASVLPARQGQSISVEMGLDVSRPLCYTPAATRGPAALSVTGAPCAHGDAMTLLDMLCVSAGRFPHRPALVFRDRRLSYSGLQETARRVGAILRALGVRQCDRVVLMLPNAPEFGVGYFGILSAGATVVPLNPLLKPAEIRYILEDSGAAAMVCIEMTYPLLQAAQHDLGRRVPALVLDAATSSVTEAAVIGVPDPVRGETPKALVVLRDGQQADPQELIQWCRQRLANYKVPRTITVVPDLPKTATGKILKTELRATG